MYTCQAIRSCQGTLNRNSTVFPCIEATFN